MRLNLFENHLVFAYIYKQNKEIVYELLIQNTKNDLKMKLDNDFLQWQCGFGYTENVKELLKT